MEKGKKKGRDRRKKGVGRGREEERRGKLGVKLFFMYLSHSAVFNTEEGVTYSTILSPISLNFTDLFLPIPSDLQEKVQTQRTVVAQDDIYIMCTRFL